MNIETKKINNLNPATYNPRKDLKPEDEEFQKIVRSIETFGYVDPIIINKDGTIIGGHQRYKVLKYLKYTEIQCVVLDISKEQEKLLNIALNKISGDWDKDKLEELLAELQNEDLDLSVTGFDFDEIDDILQDINGTKEDDFDIDAALEEIEEPITKVGDVWKLGRHYLMCGDSTQKENVLKLTNNQQIDMILTDPPYNVDYEGGTADKLKIENDNMSETEFYNFLLAAFRNMYKLLKNGGSIYVFHSDTEGINFRNAFNSVGFKLAQCLIWVKNTFVMGRQDYQWQHEPCLYGWKEGAGHYFTDDRTQSTILEYDKPQRNELHPTMKPVDMLCQLIKNSSEENQIILDLFGGSGSTLIACEQMNRTCYTMELDPKYCDVIVKRWEALTGLKAEIQE